jgi:Pyridine nucleotide-disulphide oxidoreductase, dimerisation domain
MRHPPVFPFEQTREERKVSLAILEDALNQARSGDVDIYKADFRPIKSTMSGRDIRLLMKLVVDGTTDRVVGCHIVGDSAAEITQAVGIAVKMKATKADFDATVALHPTAAEELVTMRMPTAGRHERHQALACTAAFESVIFQKVACAYSRRSSGVKLSRLRPPHRT